MADYIPEPYQAWDQHCAEQERQAERYPICSDCGEHITDETMIVISDEFICEACLDRHYRKYTEDFME